MLRRCRRVDEVEHATLLRTALGACTHALRPRLVAAEAAAAAAATAVDAIDGETEWEGFGQEAGRQLAAAALEPAPPPASLQRIEKQGVVARRVPALLGAASWVSMHAEQCPVLSSACA